MNIPDPLPFIVALRGLIIWPLAAGCFVLVRRFLRKRFPVGSGSVGSTSAVLLGLIGFLLPFAALGLCLTTVNWLIVRLAYPSENNDVKVTSGLAWIFGMFLGGFVIRAGLGKGKALPLSEDRGQTLRSGYSLSGDYGTQRFRKSRILFACLLVFTMLPLLAVILVLSLGGHVSAGIFHRIMALLLALAVTLPLFEIVVYQYSVEVSADGLRWRRWGRSFFAPWEEIEVIDWGALYSVFKLKSGKKIQLNLTYYIHSLGEVNAQLLDKVNRGLESSGRPPIV